VVSFNQKIEKKMMHDKLHFMIVCFIELKRRGKEKEKEKGLIGNRIKIYIKIIQSLKRKSIQIIKR